MVICNICVEDFRNQDAVEKLVLFVGDSSNVVVSMDVCRLCLGGNVNEILI